MSVREVLGELRNYVEDLVNIWSEYFYDAQSVSIF